MDTGGSGNNSGEDPLPLMNHTTAGHILRHATASFLSLLPTFLLLSFLLFFFHSSVESGNVFLTSFIDRDPSLRSLFSRIDASGKSIRSSSDSPAITADRNRRLRRRHFLHLTRVGTLDDGFFSGDDDDDRSTFGNYHKAQVNGSLLALSDFSRLGFSDFVVDNGVKYPEAVRTGVSFRLDGKIEEEAEIDGVRKSNPEEDEVLDLRFLVPGLELGHRDAAALFHLIGVLSVAYGCVVLGFVITYSWVLGIVFVSVVNNLLGRYVSSVENIWSGSKLGLNRLSSFILMRWALRDALTQFIGLWFFGEVEDQYSIFKLFLRLKLMPFSSSSPWIGGYEKEISGFLFAWFFMDTLVSFVFSVDSWVTLVDGKRSEREIVKEGCNLLAVMFHPALHLKCLEVILSGSFIRWGLAQICGRSFAVMVQSLIKVYFMVAWLMFYFVARNRDASLNGRVFGRSDLEGFIEGLR